MLVNVFIYFNGNISYCIAAANRILYIIIIIIITVIIIIIIIVRKNTLELHTFEIVSNRKFTNRLIWGFRNSNNFNRIISYK